MYKKFFASNIGLEIHRRWSKEAPTGLLELSKQNSKIYGSKRQTMLTEGATSLGSANITHIMCFQLSCYLNILIFLTAQLLYVNV